MNNPRLAAVMLGGNDLFDFGFAGEYLHAVAQRPLPSL